MLTGTHTYPDFSHGRGVPRFEEDNRDMDFSSTGDATRAFQRAALTGALLLASFAASASNVTLNGSGQIYWDTQWLGSAAGNVSTTATPTGSPPTGNTYTLAVPGQYGFLDQFASPQTSLLLNGTVPYENSGSPVGTYAFQDAYQFSITSATAGDVLAVSLGLQAPYQGVFNIDNLQFRLYQTTSVTPGLDVTGTVVTSWQGISGNDNGQSITTSFNNLAAGTYVLDIAGTADGTSGGTYVGQLNLNPATVPLPASLWLMLSAFAGLGLAARRRQTAGA